MDIGRNIAKLREARNMSQYELAEYLYVSRDLVSKWETGARRPDYEMIEKIAESLGARPDDIIGYDEYLFDELESCIPKEIGITEEELVPLLNAFLKKLPKRNAEIFVTRYYRLRSIAETAILCGVKENHARSILSKTREKLRNYIREKTL